MSALGQKRTFAMQTVIRSTPESGHVRCTSPCPLSANSGHHIRSVAEGLRKRLGQPTRTDVSSGSEIANSYVPHGLSSGAFLPRISLPKFRGPDVHVFHVEIKAERILARDKPTVNRSRQMKSSFAVRQHTVSLNLFWRSSFNAHKAKSAIEALRRVEIVAGQDCDNGARFHFCTPVVGYRPSIQLHAKIGKP